MSDHPCANFRCPENNQGQCFGGGCWRNPAKEVNEENESEGEDNE